MPESLDNLNALKAEGIAANLERQYATDIQNLTLKYSEFPPADIQTKYNAIKDELIAGATIKTTIAGLTFKKTKEYFNELRRQKGQPEKSA